MGKCFFIMKYFFEKVDNTNLIVFRVLFGLLMTIESWGAIVTGWVKKTFVDVNLTFNFIGFDWTQSLLGEQMYYVYLIMGALGVLIMLGMFYRVSIIAFFLLWSLTYFMQKENYNNHYYLIMIISFLLIFMPANRYLSVDSSLRVRIKSYATERWNYLLFKVVIACVYIYAAIAKLTPGWYDNHFLPIRLGNSANWFEDKIGKNAFIDLLRNPEFAQILSYAGIAFDFLIVPLLLIKPTRRLAFIFALIFHLFNSITLHIGIFPFFALSLCVFYFEANKINKWFFPKRGSIRVIQEYKNSYFRKKVITIFVLCFIVIQIYLPLRHWIIPEDVTWTEEGHRMAWRMMLRTKQGQGEFYVKLKNGEETQENIYEYLKSHQVNGALSKPDLIWQMAQIIKSNYQKRGVEGIKVYFKNSYIKINNGPWHEFINPEIDLANTKWSYFGNQKWILPSPKDYYKYD